MHKLLSLCLLVSSLAVAQTNYIDSLENTFKSKSEKTQLENILNIPYDKFVGQLDESLDLVDYGSEIAVKQNDSLSLGKLSLIRGIIYSYKDDTENRIKSVLAAIRIFEDIDALEEAGEAYTQLGYNIKFSDLPNAKSN